ncbi:MAG: FAD-dependent oxidoreductase [Bryobacteraceae bacterium]
MMSSSRRRLLSAGLVGLWPKSAKAFTGGFVDRSETIGHRLRDHGSFPSPRQTVKTAVAIVGGGIAGLSAAWRLQKRGMRDFVILEMEDAAGGNSRSGENEISAYPWAAHYLPVPDRRSTLVRELMEELGVLVDCQWDERHLCHAPQERLFLHGRWQDGIEPEVAATARDREQFRRFQDRMREFAASGEFRIPMTEPPRQAALDRMTATAWLAREGFDSEYLNWLADYGCRDDYGAKARDTSAWAAIHYFAARLDKDERGPLTWPEGNGWIVKRMLGQLGLERYVRAGRFVHRIEPAGSRFAVFAGDARFDAAAVIFAAPTFLARYVLNNPPTFPGQYSPWLTANLTLDRWPEEPRTGRPSWDNVIYRSPALGYVVATHQSLRTHIERTVWTYYWSLADAAPAESRRLLLSRDWRSWSEAILADLEVAHPAIRQCVSRIDIMRLGHGMIRPTPGFLSSPERIRAATPRGRLVFANSDLSGMSIFEEAQYRGVIAADHILRSM